MSLNKAFNTALANKLQVAAIPGKVLKYAGKLDATLASGSYFIQAWDKSDVPAAATAVTQSNNICVPVEVKHTTGTSTIFDIDLTGPDRSGVEFLNGLTIALSTTEFTYTAGTAHMSAVALWEVQ